LSKHLGYIILSFSLVVVLSACAILSPGPASVSVESSVDDRFTSKVPASPSADSNAALTSSIKQLVLAHQKHEEGNYAAALELYEAVLVDKASLLSDAYALLGLIAMGLDRDNPAYSRERASNTLHVFHQRIEQAAKTDVANEARLLRLTASLLLKADVNKDQVMLENSQLLDELAQRDEAIKRLRELTLAN
tara:strand:+ start:27380 stop:27955 length:576 start_codon:yes stop_codon:yes gene_type:complete